MRSQATRAISGRVNADGTPATGGAFASRRSAAGLYFLTFPGARLVGGVAANGSGGNYFIAPDTYTGDGCRVVVANAAGSTNVDALFSFTATVAA